MAVSLAITSGVGSGRAGLASFTALSKSAFVQFAVQ